VSLAPRERVVCVKPWVGMWGTEAERMVVSVDENGPDGGGWS